MRFHRLIVPVDGSATSSKALGAAFELAQQNGARVRIVHAIEELPWISGYEDANQVRQAVRQAGNQVLADALAAAKASGVEADTRLVESAGQRLGQVMAAEAQAWDADLVVVGTHGRRGIGRALLGSGAENVIRLAALPVLVIRSDE
jgi:nucleotide-binding universal stress UspA family protein